MVRTTNPRTHTGRTLTASLLLACAVPAVAMLHTQLDHSVPAKDEVVTAPLDTLRLVFSAGVEPTLTWVALVSPSGDTVGARAPDPVPGTSNAEYVAPAPPLREAGAWSMLWRTAGADGHVISGTVPFTVDSSALAIEPEPVVPPPQAEEPAPPPPAEPGGIFRPQSIPSIATRWLQFAALLAVLGVAGFRFGVAARSRLGGETRGRVDDALRRALAYAGVALLLALAFRLFLQVGAVFGSFDTGALGGYLSGTGWGRGWIVQAGAALLITIAAFAGVGATAGAVTAGGAAVAAYGTAMTAHAASFGGLAVVVDGTHIIAAGTWLGTLAVLLLVAAPAAWRSSQEGRGRTIADLVHAFSPLALTAAGVVVLTGVLNAIRHLETLSVLWETAWGRTLLVKVALVLVAAGAGFFNWRFVRPALGDDAGAQRLRRSAGLELATAAIILLVTAILVAVPMPG